MGSNNTWHPNKIWIRATEQCRACGAANRTIRVERIKPHAIGHEGVDMGCLQIFRAITREVAIAEIVDEYNENIRLGLCQDWQQARHRESNNGSHARIVCAMAGRVKRAHSVCLMNFCMRLPMMSPA